MLEIDHHSEQCQLLGPRRQPKRYPQSNLQQRTSTEQPRMLTFICCWVPSTVAEFKEKLTQTACKVKKCHQEFYVTAFTTQLVLCVGIKRRILTISSWEGGLVWSCNSELTGEYGSQSESDEIWHPYPFCSSPDAS